MATNNDGNTLHNLQYIQDARLNNSSWTEEVELGSNTWQLARVKDLAIRWNQLYPYRLVIVTKQNGEWVITKQWEATSYTFPIPPQSLNIDMPFAFSVEATQGGVIEQSNGAPFRDITLQGTTGVLPLRGVTERAGPLNPAEGVFLGAVTLGTAAGQTITTAVQNSVALPARTAPNVIPAADFASTQPNSPAMGTGYAQFLLLKRFLEWYANIKKNKANSNMTLGFQVFKENEIYLVTPQTFSVSRSASNPLAYQYSIRLRAWGRVLPKTSSVGSLAPHEFVGRNPNLYARVLNGIEGARRTLESAKKFMQASVGDIKGLLSNIRRVSLVASDALGVSITASQLSEDLVRDFQKPLFDAVNSGIVRLEDISTNTGALAGGNSTQMQELLDDLKRLAALYKLDNTNKIKQFNREGSNAGMRIFSSDHPLFHQFWSLIDINKLNLSPVTVRKIEDERQSVRDLQRVDFERIRDEALRTLADLERSVGVGDDVFDDIYGTPDRPQVREATDEDWDAMFALAEVARNLDAMAASHSIDPIPAPSASELMAGWAERSGTAFTVPQSKFLVPFPYGYTLEQLANQYLGNPDRWMEIATLNGLRAPYVDEVGYQQDFATNGSGNQFAVIDSSRYYVNQTVWLSALGVKREKRHITKIQVLSPTLSLITVDGAGDLDRFKLVNEAFVHSFLPGTVNSLMYLYIPSDSPADDDWNVKSIPGVDSLDPLLTVGGVDLLLDSNGDLVITPDGTTRLSSGLTNLIQRIRIAVATPRGSLMHHPEFGFGVIAGSSTADVTAQDILKAAKEFVQNEEGFTGVNYAAVMKKANGMTISMSIGIAGVNKNVPVTIDLR